MILFLLKGKSDDASTRVRVLNYLPLLENENINFKTISYRYYQAKSLSSRIINTIFRRTFVLRVILKVLLSKPTKVYVQKIILNRKLIFFLKKRGTTILLDLDDAIFLRGKEKEDFSEYLDKVDKLIVCSDFYKELTTEKKAIIIPSCVHKVKNAISLKNDPLQLCWIGSPYTEKYLIEIKDQLIKLLDNNPEMVLELVGTSSDLDIKHPNIILKEWSIEQENKTLKKATIGIMPISHDEWSKYKCAYKLLLYMSNGVLAVGSDWGANSRVIESNKSGILVKSKNDWYDSLNYIINNFEQYKNVAIRGRTRVDDNFSYSSNYIQWKQAILN